MNYSLNLKTALSWLFGTIVFINGILNLIFGNDPGLGVAFVCASFLFFPPTCAFIEEKIGFTIPNWTLVLLAVLIFWITGAVGAISEGYVF